MIGKIKALGLAFVAITAMSAVAAGSAQAVSSLDVGSSTSGNATLTAQIETGQEHVLTLLSTAGSKFNSNCTNALLEGTTLAGVGVPEATTTATYSGCKLFGLNATVQMHACKYTVTTTAKALTASVDVTGCTTGKAITIKNLTCTLEIPEQNGLSQITFENQANNHVKLVANVTNITVKQNGAGCPDGNGHHSNNASFTGNTTLTAFNDTGTEQVTEHGHLFTKSKHSNGAALTLTAT